MAIPTVEVLTELADALNTGWCLTRYKGRWKVEVDPFDREPGGAVIDGCETVAEALAGLLSVLEHGPFRMVGPISADIASRGARIAAEDYKGASRVADAVGGEGIPPALQ